jgi:ubiquinone/menaquinone biosynthesis C-methylase UbiE
MKKTSKFSEGLLNHELILDCLNIGAGQTLLDAGCGSGYMALKCSQRVGPGGKVYALDTNEGFIATLRKEVENTNIEVLVGDITRPVVLEDASIDLVGP